MRVETKQPKRGDLVRVTFEAKYDTKSPYKDHFVHALPDEYYYSVPENATIEVLKPEPKEGDWGVWTTLSGRREFVRFGGTHWEDASGAPLHWSHPVEPLDG